MRDFTLSARPMTGKRDLPYDRAVRTATFVRRTKVVHSRVELGAVLAPGDGMFRIRFQRPNGSAAAETRTVVRTAHGRGHWSFTHRVSLGRVGSWRVSDVLRRGLAGAGKRVRCSATPSDGRLSGPTATTPLDVPRKPGFAPART